MRVISYLLLDIRMWKLTFNTQSDIKESENERRHLMILLSLYRSDLHIIKTNEKFKRVVLQ